jgi:ribonuclease HI
MKEIIVYTDGACRGNPGPGGYGAILLYKNHKKTISGGFRHTTNNRMEMLAVIESLKSLKVPCLVKLYTDSRYICDAINKGWINKWKTKNWLKSPMEPVKNRDLWQTLDGLRSIHTVQFNWVKGHSDNELNNEADEIAVMASKDTINLETDAEFEITAGLSFG